LYEEDHTYSSIDDCLGCDLKASSPYYSVPPLASDSKTISVSEHSTCGDTTTTKLEKQASKDCIAIGEQAENSSPLNENVKDNSSTNNNVSIHGVATLTMHRNMPGNVVTQLEASTDRKTSVGSCDGGDNSEAGSPYYSVPPPLGKDYEVTSDSVYYSTPSDTPTPSGIKSRSSDELVDNNELPTEEIYSVACDFQDDLESE